jgi:hypothetical protein
MSDEDWRFLTFNPREFAGLAIAFGVLVFAVCSAPPPVAGATLGEVARAVAGYYLPYGRWALGVAFAFAMTRVIMEIFYLGFDNVSALRDDTPSGFFVRTYLLKIVICAVFLTLCLTLKALGAYD